VGRRTWVAGSNFALKFAAKPLQTETWLLLATYRNSLPPYPTVPSPTPYYVRYSHNTRVTDKWQTNKRQKRSAKN